jgi:hypothetical protein
MPGFEMREAWVSLLGDGACERQLTWASSRQFWPRGVKVISQLPQVVFHSTN